MVVAAIGGCGTGVVVLLSSEGLGSRQTVSLQEEGQYSRILSTLTHLIHHRLIL